MQVKVNGEPHPLAQDPTALTDLLRQLGIDPAQPGIAVAVNWELVPRSEWTDQQITSGDEIEIVTARQGG